MNSFRTTKPCRTYNKNYARYNSYKPYLRSDFNKKCGYCDDLDLFNGGKRTYQIDHFVPMKPAAINITIIETDYSNLVYACPFCNRAKSNKWFTNDETEHNDGTVGFVDPCSDEYETHFFRSPLGEIRTNTSLGQHIYNELDFYLKRHAILWNVERLSKGIKALKQSLTQVHEQNLKKQLSDLLLEHYNFLEQLEIEND